MPFFDINSHEIHLITNYLYKDISNLKTKDNSPFKFNVDFHVAKHFIGSLLYWNELCAHIRSTWRGIIRSSKFPSIGITFDISNTSANYNDLFVESSKKLQRVLKGSLDIYALGLSILLSLLLLKVKFSKR